MECPNCQFQNVPGMRACARCQSTLDLSSVQIEPPRAGVRVLPTSVRQASFRGGLALGNGLRRAGRSIKVHPDLNMGALARSVIPGWGHRRLGYRRFGWGATAAWLFLAFVAFFMQGGPGGWTAYFVLVGWHSFVVSLILANALRDASMRRRVVVGILAYALLNGLIYLPAGLLMRQFVVPFTAAGIASGPVLRNGDVVLRTGPWLGPGLLDRGDVVVYRFIRLQVGGHANAQGGFGIDRVLAVPGDEVSMGSEGVRVNGTLLAKDAGPLRPILLPTFTTTVPEGSYLILPSVLQIHLQGDQSLRDALIRSVCLVPASEIDGKVLCRTRPFARAGALRPDDAARTAAGKEVGP